jgi:hypothetical protein
LRASAESVICASVQPLFSPNADADHPLLVQVWRLADERGYGKVSQPVTLTIEERLRRMREILEEAAREKA